MDFLTIVKTVAPRIGTALGGPAGRLRGSKQPPTALGFTAKTADALKQDERRDPRANACAEAGGSGVPSSDAGAWVANVEKLVALAVENRKDARAMQVATRSAVPAVLAVLITAGFFGVLVGMLSGWLKTTDNQPFSSCSARWARHGGPW